MFITNSLQNKSLLFKSLRRFSNTKSLFFPTDIFYTKTDEAPALATEALFPVLERFCKPFDVNLNLCDISLASRVLSLWSDRLSPDQQIQDNLGFLGDLVKKPNATIIKLPNISASVPQLIACIRELKSKGVDLYRIIYTLGFNIPDFPSSVDSKEDQIIAEKYGKVLGSAVNPVLREGNSNRRAAQPVKAYAQRNPTKLGPWSKESKTHVAHMSEGDFFESEYSHLAVKDTNLRIEFVDEKTNCIKILYECFPVKKGDVIDASFMSRERLTEYFEKEFADARRNDLAISLHLKATMMKKSDPKIFGAAIETFFKPLFTKHGNALKEVGVDPSLGLQDLEQKIQKLDSRLRSSILSSIKSCFENRPQVMMVNENRTNFHVPSDVIVDASMPSVIRDSGCVYVQNKQGSLENKETKCLIPDRSYARQYSAALEFVRTHGQFDPATMGHTSNIGLMAQRAEEYGSHPTTFEAPSAGLVRVISSDGTIISCHSVGAKDIWRMCRTTEAAINNWILLAVERAKASQIPAIFWLDGDRSHDRILREIVDKKLSSMDLSGIEIAVMNLKEAMIHTLERARAGKDTISVTGNIMRDYNTDLFPILELGTSAKMLSIVPLLSGGGLYETGAGGSAPKHVTQFLQEGHLRWDSLGEYLAFAVALEELGDKNKSVKNSVKIKLLGETLNKAITQLLEKGKSPTRKTGELDNRGSTFYLCLYWAKALVKRGESSFETMARELEKNCKEIESNLLSIQGKSVDLNGYYLPDKTKTVNVMRPCELFNKILLL